MLISMASSVLVSAVPATISTVSRGAPPTITAVGSTGVSDEESFYRMLQSFPGGGRFVNRGGGRS